MKTETIHKIPCTRHINAKGSNAASEKPKQRAEKKLENDKLCGFNVTVAFISLLLQRMCVCVCLGFFSIVYRLDFCHLWQWFKIH